jgi:hypothetical protein
VRQRYPGSAKIAIVALSIVMGTAACGSDEPGADRSDPITVLDASAPDTVASSTTDATTPGSPTTTAVTSASTEPTTAAATSAPTATTVESELGLSEADVTELEQQLDEIDRVLADMEAQLSQD